MRVRQPSKEARARAVSRAQQTTALKKLVPTPFGFPTKTIDDYRALAKEECFRALIWAGEIRVQTCQELT